MLEVQRERKLVFIVVDAWMPWIWTHKWHRKLAYNVFFRSLHPCASRILSNFTPQTQSEHCVYQIRRTFFLETKKNRGNVTEQRLRHREFRNWPLEISHAINASPLAIVLLWNSPFTAITTAFCQPQRTLFMPVYSVIKLNIFHSLLRISFALANSYHSIFKNQ